MSTTETSASALLDIEKVPFTSTYAHLARTARDPFMCPVASGYGRP